MTVLRATSVYQADLIGADSEALDAALSRCHPAYEVAASGMSKGSAFVRFRAPSDDRLAAAVATQFAHGVEFRLRTGYGVNQRVVDVRPPAGCFCLIMEAPDACLTCTCPDCGAVGRFGISIVHGESCE